jgi:hypothetical protein
LWPFKKKKPEIILPPKPPGLIDYGVIVEKYREGSTMQKYRVDLHLYGKKGYNKAQIEQVLRYSYSYYFAKLNGQPHPQVAIRLHALENKQVILGGVNGSDLNPDITLNELSLNYLKDVPTVEHDIPYVERQIIYKQAEGNYDKAIAKANTTYDDFTAPKGKENYLPWLKEKNEYLKKVNDQLDADLAKRFGISNEVLTKIINEGVANGWPKK